MAMATATYPGGTASVVTVTNAATFIPEIWSDEIIATYKTKLVMANLVKKMSMKGKKGDVIHIPMPLRGSAYAKAAATAVTLQANVETEKTVTINQHFEYSRHIEDITEAQALSSLRKFYTDDAGYALARQVDTALIQLGRQAGIANTATTTVYANAYIGGDGTTAYASASDNESAITDAAIRRTIQRLDDHDVPMEDRYLVIPPSARNTMMGLSRFTEQAFVGEAGSGNTIRNGRIGDVYGVEVYVTPNCEVAAGGSAKIALMFHRDAFVLAEQLGVRTQTQYQQEYLATLLTADTLYGVQILRNGSDTGTTNPASAFALAVPA